MKKSRKKTIFQKLQKLAIGNHMKFNYVEYEVCTTIFYGRKTAHTFLTHFEDFPLEI